MSELSESAVAVCAMASKKGNAVRLETEIEKSREDARWQRVIELAEQLKQGSPNHGKKSTLNFKFHLQVPKCSPIFLATLKN